MCSEDDCRIFRGRIIACESCAYRRLPQSNDAVLPTTALPDVMDGDAFGNSHLNL